MWPFKAAAPVAAYAATPLVVATEGAPASAVDKIIHAQYRLDAIARTLEQSGAAIKGAHRAEFRSEVRDHCHTLVQANIMTDEEAHSRVKNGGSN